MDCNVLGSSAVRFDGFQSWSGELPDLVCSHIYIAEDIYGAYIYTHIYIAGLKLNIQRMKIMASSPITPWKVDKETMETVTDFIFLGSKITADGDCSHEIKRCLLLRRKAMTNLDRGMVWGGRREEGSGWGTHVYLWQIHFEKRQN